MEFQCGSCGAVMEAPDEIGGATFECPNCGEDIVAPLPGQVEVDVELKDTGAMPEAPYEDAVVESAPLTEAGMYAEEAAMSLGQPHPHEQAVREKHKKRPEEKLGWALWLLILLVIATVALGGYYAYVKVPAVTEKVDKWLGKEKGGSVSKKAPKPDDPSKRGVLPAGYYLAEKVAGVSEGPAVSGASEWQVPGAEDGNRWLVIEMSVPAGVFIPAEERYEGMKGEYARRYGEDAAALFPTIKQCRFFDPTKVVVVRPDGEEFAETEGSLISVLTAKGAESGFYQGFESYKEPGGSGRGSDSWADADEQITIEVAFLLAKGGGDGDGFDPAGLKVRVGELDEVKVPATLLR